MNDINSIESFNKIHEKLKQFNNLWDKPIVFKDNLLKDLNIEFNLVWFIYKNKKGNQDYFIYFSLKQPNKLISKEISFFKEKLKYFNFQIEWDGLTISNCQNIKSELSENLKMINREIFLKFWFKDLTIDKDKSKIIKNKQQEDWIIIEPKELDIFDNDCKLDKIREETLKKALYNYSYKDNKLTTEEIAILRIKNYCRVEKKEAKYLFAETIDNKILFYELTSNLDISSNYRTYTEDKSKDLKLKDIKEKIWFSKVLKIWEKNMSAIIESSKLWFVYLFESWLFFSNNFKIKNVSFNNRKEYLKFDTENNEVILINVKLLNRRLLEDKLSFINIDGLEALNTKDNLIFIKINNINNFKILNDYHYLYKNTYYSGSMEELIFFKDEKENLKILKADEFKSMELKGIQKFNQIDFFNKNTFLSWEKAKFNSLKSTVQTAYILVKNEEDKKHSIILRKNFEHALTPLFVNQKNLWMWSKIKKEWFLTDELEISEHVIELNNPDIFLKGTFNLINNKFENLSKNMESTVLTKIQEKLLNLKEKKFKANERNRSLTTDLKFIITNFENSYFLYLGRNWHGHEMTYSFWNVLIKTDSKILYELNNFKINL